MGASHFERAIADWTFVYGTALLAFVDDMLYYTFTS
jgi:hypothetical protein